MSSELQLDVCHLNQWWRHLVNAYEVKRQVWCLLQVKLCDPCLSALEWFVYYTRRYTSARIYLYLTFNESFKKHRFHVSVTPACNFKGSNSLCNQMYVLHRTWHRQICKTPSYQCEASVLLERRWSRYSHSHSAWPDAMTAQYSAAECHSLVRLVAQHSFVSAAVHSPAHWLYTT